MRFADDFVVGFEHREDAERFSPSSASRFATVRLGAASGEDAADRVRAVRRRGSSQARGRKPETFEFLGFTHICATTRKRAVQAQADHDKKRMHASCARSRPSCATRCISRSLSKDAGSPASCAGTTAITRCPTTRGARRFRERIIRHWLRRCNAAASAHDDLGADAAPRRPMAAQPRILHPWPDAAIRRQNPREEPSALDAHAGICAGGGRQRPSLPRLIPAAPRARGQRSSPIGRDPKGPP